MSFFLIMFCGDSAEVRTGHHFDITARVEVLGKDDKGRTKVHLEEHLKVEEGSSAIYYFRSSLHFWMFSVM